MGKMKVYVSRSIYDDAGKIKKIIAELKAKGHEVTDGVRVYRSAKGRGKSDEEAMESCFRKMDHCDFVLFVPTFTPGVREEYKAAVSLKKRREISRRIVK